MLKAKKIQFSTLITEYRTSEIQKFIFPDTFLSGFKMVSLAIWKPDISATKRPIQCDFQTTIWNQTIWQLDLFGPLEYWNSLVFRTLLYESDIGLYLDLAGTHL